MSGAPVNAGMPTVESRNETQHHVKGCGVGERGRVLSASLEFADLAQR